MYEGQKIMVLFDSAKSHFEKALSYLDVSPDARKILESPKETLEAQIPVRMDDGSLKVFTGTMPLQYIL